MTPSGLRLFDTTKRAFDILVSTAALVVLSPVIAFVALLVALKLGRPVFFRQRRPGIHGKIFGLVKFRTMLSVDEARGIVTNEQRLTHFGSRLRNWSVDELPSLWNVIRGDMSLVGPRPLRVSYLRRYSSEQQRRHEVRPGLTGLAQVRGRNALAWDDRLELDLEYVKHRSWKLDLQILAETVSTVLRRDGVVEEGQATRSEFLGPTRTSRVQLLPLAREHLATRVRWLNHPSVREGISISFTADLATTEQWFSGAAIDRDRHDWVGVDRSSGLPVSMCGIQKKDEEAFSLYIYVDPALHGKGYGRDTLELLIARARSLGVRTLILETPANNEAAARLYYRLGFEELGMIETGAKRQMRFDVGLGHADE